MFACSKCCGSHETDLDEEQKPLITDKPQYTKQYGDWEHDYKYLKNRVEELEKENRELKQRLGHGTNQGAKWEQIITEQPQCSEQYGDWEHENKNLKNRVEELEKENSELKQTMRGFSERENQDQTVIMHNEELAKENKELKQVLSHDQRGKLQSKRMRETGSFEDLNDKFLNRKLNDRLSIIYKREWRLLKKVLRKRFKDELCVLSFISEIMKSIYEDCKAKAADGFAYGNKDPLSDVFSVNEFRKVNGQTDIALTNITMELKRKYNLSDKTGGENSVRKRYGSIDSTLKDHSVRKHEDSYPVYSNLLRTFESVNEYSKFDILSWIIHVDPDILKTFERFFVAVVECFWLMIVSDPPIKLNFGEQILGKKFDKEMEKHFEKYATDEPVIKPKIVGTIIKIIWPELNDNHGTHKRGLVVTVKESIGTEV